MITKPVIFISAVSKELKSARQLVANTLLSLGYEPDFQEIFSAGAGDLNVIHQQKLNAAAGVIQLVGHCYGFEPQQMDAQFGRVSYTQYEALYARKQKKKVWYIILNPDHPHRSP